MIVSSNLSFSVKSCVKEDREASIIIQNNLFVNGSIHINDVDTNVIRNIINQKIPPASLVKDIRFVIILLKLKVKFYNHIDGLK